MTVTSPPSNGSAAPKAAAGKKSAPPLPRRPPQLPARPKSSRDGASGDGAALTSLDAQAPGPTVTAAATEPKKSEIKEPSRTLAPTLSPSSASSTSVSLKAQQPTAVQQEQSATTSAPKPKRRDLEPPAEPFQVWETYYAEGEPYYVNRQTNETTWDKPEALMSLAEQSALDGEFVWVPHETLAWIPAKIIESREDGSLVVAESPQGAGSNIELHSRRHVSAKEAGPRVQSAKALTSLTSDLVQLDDVHEQGIIDLLRRRYNAEKIYTSVGDILIAINPFKPTGLFSPTLMQDYAQTGSQAMDLPPHPYAVIHAAYRSMLDDRKDQSLLISGESGAGKTVTVKVCLEFLSEIAGSDNNIEQKILAANPILEAFGNAKTIRNDNSSRFGKFMEIHFGQNGSSKIVGCHTVNYLLEKCRVVDQAPGERNFHVFHYLVNNFSAELRAKYKVDGCTFAFLPEEALDGGQHEDAVECEKMHHALEAMGFSEKEQESMFRIVAAILHLGNIKFEASGSTGSRITDASKTYLDTFCSLSETSGDKVSEALTMHISEQRDGVLKRPFDTKMAGDARNALARHLYDRLFEWIVARVNKAMVLDEALPNRGRSSRSLSSSETNFIGMLDIFGFEIFQENSFEQLCINFANEKLQQMFNHHTFSLEEQTYLDEGVPFEAITFHDSQPLLSFLGLARPGAAPVRDGVFQLLDEQTAMHGDDVKFLHALSSRHGDKKNLFSDRCKSRSAFQVFHYAGNVEYDSTNFVFKNADKLYENIQEALANSSLELVSSVFASNEAESSGPRRKKAVTQASTFIRQLAQLEERTGATFPRYIRCIKPNGSKAPGVFMAPECLEQLRFAGVFEAVKIRKVGYPFRKTHESFFSTYRCINPETVPPGAWSEAQASNHFAHVAKLLMTGLAAAQVPSAKDCHFGKTMVLYRAEQHRNLEICRLAVQNRAASQIQKRFRGMYVRSQVPLLRSCRTELERAIASRQPEQLDTALATSSKLFYKIKEAYDAEAVKEALKLEISLEPIIRELLEQCKRDGAAFNDGLYDRLDTVCGQMKKFMKRDKLAFSANQRAADLIAEYDTVSSYRQFAADSDLAISQIPHVEAHKSVQQLSRLHDQVLSWKQGALPGEVQMKVDSTRQALELLRGEIDLFKEFSTVVKSCYVVASSDPGHSISVDKTRQTLPELQRLQQVIASTEMQSVDGVEASSSAALVAKLYHVLLLAMEKESQQESSEWDDVEAVLGECNVAKGASNDLFAVDEDQLSLISSEVALRVQVEDVVRKLTQSIEEVNDEPMSTALDQAHALKMHEHREGNVRDIVQQAEELLSLIAATRSKLAEGIRAVSETLLREGLELQNECSWGEREGMPGHQLVEHGRTLLVYVENLTREARVAAKAFEVEPTRIVVEGCDEIGLHVSELDTLRTFLGLPHERQLSRQLDAAIEIQNYKRAVQVSISRKDLLFDSDGSFQNFDLQNFPKLKTADEFARRFGIRFSRYKSSMLHFYNPTFGKIHTSMTNFEQSTDSNGKSLQKVATNLFKNVFGIMGDKIYENVDSLVLDLFLAVLATEALVDEIYCQVMKQVSKNPKAESEARGWNLMSMLLAVVPPSPELENYLEAFLRRSGKLSCVKGLHRVLLCGPLCFPPSIDQIHEERTTGGMDAWFDGPRTRFALSKEDLSGTVTVDHEVFDWKVAKIDLERPLSPLPRPSQWSEELYTTAPSRTSQQPPPPPSARKSQSVSSAAGPPPPPVRLSEDASQSSERAVQLPPPPPAPRPEDAARSSERAAQPPPPPPPVRHSIEQERPISEAGPTGPPPPLPSVPRGEHQQMGGLPTRDPPAIPTPVGQSTNSHTPGYVNEFDDDDDDDDDDII